MGEVAEAAFISDRGHLEVMIGRIGKEHPRPPEAVIEDALGERDARALEQAVNVARG
jgi:hypothetical protein